MSPHYASHSACTRAPRQPSQRKLYTAAPPPRPRSHSSRHLRLPRRQRSLRRKAVNGRGKVRIGAASRYRRDFHRSTHAGEYPGRKSGQDVKLINANLDCNENFVKGFGVSEFIVTPAILGLAAVLANINKEESY